jgi:hypothetical protein
VEGCDAGEEDDDWCLRRWGLYCDFRNYSSMNNHLPSNLR